MTKATRLGAIGLLVAGGAAAVGASTTKDTDGNNRVLSGSDTLKLVVQQVLTNTPGAVPGPTAPVSGNSTDGTYFVGGGQSVSDSAITANTQQISVGTASLKNTAYIGIKIDSENSGTNTLAIQGTTEALLLGLDGLSILANNTANGAPTAPSGLGLGLAVAGKSFIVNAHNADGSEDTTHAPTFPGSATGANANYGAVFDGTHWTYTLQSSIDVIRLIYGGLHHNGPSNIGDFNANSDVRRSLANQWESIFNTTTAVSGTKQLNHAYRRSDLAGTTNAFIALVGFGTRKLGTLTGNVSGTNKTTSPFANDAAAAGLTVGNATGAITLSKSDGTPVNNDPTANGPLGQYLALARNDVNQIVVNNAGSGDQLDLDPIRRPATHTGAKSIDLVASPGSAALSGTLGLVQTIFYPDTAGITQAQAYPTILADSGAFDFLSAGPGGFDTAPVGPTLAQNFLQPYWLSDGSSVTGGNVTTNHQQLNATGDHYVTVVVTKAKGARDPDVDIAVINDGDPANIHLATPPAQFYKHHYNNVTTLNNVPAVAYANDDGRAFNGPVRNDLTGAYVKDANNRELAAGWYKVRSLGAPVPATNAAFLPYAPNLQQTTSDFQTGALIAADPKSIGFTGRGVDTNTTGSAFNTVIQALWLSGDHAANVNFNSALSTPPTDQNVLNLLVNPDGSIHASPLDTAQGAAVYPLARRTYLATLVGFSENPPWSRAGKTRATGTDPGPGTYTFNPAAVASDTGPAVRGLQGEEYELAKAFGDSDHVGAAFLANGFIPLPPTSAYIYSAPPPPVNGVYALDYPELNSTAPTASFLATGAGATPGGTNRDATIVSPPVLKAYGVSSSAAGAPPTSPYPFHAPWPDPSFPAY
jgi:hypothetical protein